MDNTTLEPQKWFLILPDGTRCALTGEDSKYWYCEGGVKYPKCKEFTIAAEQVVRELEAGNMVNVWQEVRKEIERRSEF